MKRPICKAMGLGMGAALSLAVSTALAEPMPARETARVLPQKGVSVGLMSPTAIGLGHGVEVTTMLVPWFLLSPNVSIRAELVKSRSGIVLTSEYGLGVPSGAMWMLQGYLFPSYAVSGTTPPFILQQHAGFWLSGGTRGVWTARADVTIGLGNDAAFQPIESYAPFDLWFAPATSWSRWHVGGTYDYAILDWLRVRGGLHGYVVGKSASPDRSLFYLGVDAALEARLGKRFRLALGAVWYNYDNGQIDVEIGENGFAQNVRVRSNDFLPTLDLVYYSP